MAMKNTVLHISIGVILVASMAQAIPTWPVSWTTVTVGGNNYGDRHYDSDPLDNRNQPPAPEVTDITGNQANPAAFYAYDSQNVYFRVRIDGAPGPSPQYVWSAVLNTDADQTADWVIQLDLKTDNQVEMAQATGGSFTDVNPWSGLAYVATPHTSPNGGVATDWYRFVDTTDSTTFPDTPPGTDYYVDFAFDRATLESQVGTTVDSMQVVFATSTTHINSIQDLPDSDWSDPITVPEPTSMVLFALGITAVALRRRKM